MIKICGGSKKLTGAARDVACGAAREGCDALVRGGVDNDARRPNLWGGGVGEDEFVEVRFTDKAVPSS